MDDKLEITWGEKWDELMNIKWVELKVSWMGPH